MPLSDRLKALRERFEERTRERKRKTRAKELAEKTKRGKRKQRIRQGNPDGLREGVAVAAKEGKKAKEAASETISAEKRFIAAELGVSTEEAGKIIEQGEALLSEVDDIRQLDVDGDGDSDILMAADSPEGTLGAGDADGSDSFGRASEFDDEGTFGQESSGTDFDPTEPVFDPFDEDSEDDLEL